MHTLSNTVQHHVISLQASRASLLCLSAAYRFVEPYAAVTQNGGFQNSIVHCTIEFSVDESIPAWVLETRVQNHFFSANDQHSAPVVIKNQIHTDGTTIWWGSLRPWDHRDSSVSFSYPHQQISTRVRLQFSQALIYLPRAVCCVVIPHEERNDNQSWRRCDAVCHKSQKSSERCLKIDQENDTPRPCRPARLCPPTPIHSGRKGPSLEQILEQAKNKILGAHGLQQPGEERSGRCNAAGIIRPPVTVEKSLTFIHSLPTLGIYQQRALLPGRLTKSSKCRCAPMVQAR